MYFQPKDTNSVEACLYFNKMYPIELFDCLDI